MLGATYSALELIFWVLAIAAFIFEVVALIHAIRTPPQAFAAAGKQTKQIWLLILGFATFFGLCAAVGFFSVYGLGSIFVIAGVIAAGIYMADVRPAVGGMGRGGSSSGPYGPW